MRTANLTFIAVSALTLLARSSAAAAPATQAVTAATAPASNAAAGDSATDDSSDDAETTSKKKKPARTKKADADSGNDSSSSIAEHPHQTYLYLGLRYGGDVIPKFLLNAFVDGGETIYSNSIAAELDYRRDGFSIIPSLVYSDFNTGNMLFHQKGKSYDDYNWSMVNSSLKAISGAVDLRWSTPIAETVDFEYGVGFSLGFVVGSLSDNWVWGPSTTTGAGLTKCNTTSDGQGCEPASHTNPSPAKVGNYNEPNWFNGGSSPSVLPNISAQVAGIRFRPVEELEARIGLGVALTGFWFSVSADYGLPSGGSSSGAKGASTASRSGGISF